MFNYAQRWQIILVSQKIADRVATHTCNNSLKPLAQPTTSTNIPDRTSYPRLAIAPTSSNQADPGKCDRPNQKFLS
ncbi:hypothetical protein QT971_00745 [Microcoleus sp. herbarium19]|uniref:hypothetical protein n=1 Tax=unclassified Microcoleus TaxID=2642155 RepID=UPI002FD3D8B8